VASQNLHVDIPRRTWNSTSLFCCGLLTGWLMCRVMDQNSTLWQAYKTLWNIFLKITVFLMHGSSIFSNNVVRTIISPIWEWFILFIPPICGEMRTIEDGLWLFYQYYFPNMIFPFSHSWPHCLCESSKDFGGFLLGERELRDNAWDLHTGGDLLWLGDFCQGDSPTMGISREYVTGIFHGIEHETPETNSKVTKSPPNFEFDQLLPPSSTPEAPEGRSSCSGPQIEVLSCSLDIDKAPGRVGSQYWWPALEARAGTGGMAWRCGFNMVQIHSNPIGSMYAIYGNIYHQYTPNVSIYTIHGSYGNIVALNIWFTMIYTY
jgi:hypothetical protein